MIELQVRFKKLSETAIPFSYTREGDACMDVYADEKKVLYPEETAIVKTGIALEIPYGYEGRIRGRSGLASTGVYVHTGTIDSTYRGDVGVIITNHSDGFFVIEKGKRIAQFTIKPVYHITLLEASQLSQTDRGEKGYGSSGF